ncbi:hypothetical protein JB92DRAFT_2835219 [Gautieria morchelliformis]|nr:hypothetical protein JB92DRAFT_2835219 [Gautieria morchelliformis]
MSFDVPHDPVWWASIYTPGSVAGMSIASFRTNHAFIRSHLGTYFVCLIIAEIVQAVGSIMSARWIVLREVHAGPFCAAQGALKNAGNVSTALWSLIIAIHTFTLLFLKVRVPQAVLHATLVLVWLFVGFLVVLGPAALERPEKGPFWGVSGHWCWITANYMPERFAMEYLFMAVTAIVSLLLYSLMFLRLRGNIDVTGSRVAFCRARTPWQRVPNMSDPQIERVGRTMLLYPLCYVVLVLPIAACRWNETYGGTVPFGVTIFADSVFILSGLVNAVLYSTTRRVVPREAIMISSKSASANSRRLPAHVKAAQAMESFQVGHSSIHMHTEKSTMVETIPVQRSVDDFIPKHSRLHSPSTSSPETTTDTVYPVLDIYSAGPSSRFDA